MKDNSINYIIQQSISILEKEVGLAKSSIEVVASRSFKPIAIFFDAKKESCYSEALINELEELFGRT